MFRKILLFILLIAGFSGWTQQLPPDYDCFNIDIDLGYHRERDENGAQIKDSYIVCRDQTVNIPPLLEVDYLRRTDVYDVTSLAYNPYPLDPAVNGGEEVNDGVNFYDERTPCPITLPFKFSFFDQTFERIWVWGNGAVNFITGTNCVGSPYVSALGQVFSGPIPGGLTGNFGQHFRNSIFGSFQHTHWDNGQYLGGSINYQTYGTAPCRKFVISFFNMPASGVVASYCPPPVPRQHHQIILHETTNVIDVNIVRHDACPATIASESLGVIGIVNENDTEAYTPPNRNLGNWDAEFESWRFAPNGEALFDIEWVVDGIVVSTLNGDSPDLSLDLQVDSRKEVRVNLVVETISGEEWSESYEIDIRPAIEVDQLDLQPIICDKDQNSYDLNSITQMIKAAQTTSETELDKLNFLYYNTEDDARDKLNQITNIRQFGVEEGENPVFVRIESEIEECFEILESNIIKAPVEVINKVDVFLCDEYTLPTLTNEEFYYKIERLDENMQYIVKTISDVYENMSITEAGYYRVYVKKTNEYGCENVKSSLLMVESCKYPKGISPNYDGDNDYLDLTYNNVQELKIYNRHGKLVYEAGDEYKREWAGQDMNDKLLPAGTYFLYVKTKNYEYQDWIQLIYEAK